MYANEELPGTALPLQLLALLHEPDDPPVHVVAACVEQGAAMDAIKSERWTIPRAARVRAGKEWLDVMEVSRLMLLGLGFGW